MLITRTPSIIQYQQNINLSDTVCENRTRSWHHCPKNQPIQNYIDAPGSLQVKLLDKLYNISETEFKDRLKLT